MEKNIHEQISIMNRRRFFYSTGAFAIAAGTAGFIACSKEDDSGSGGGGGNNARFSADLNTKLNTVGSSETQNKIIVVRISEGNTASSFIAFTSICTHEGCTVGFQSNKFVCPCHGSQYSMDGIVIQGPAMSPLTKYSVKIENNLLTIV